MSSKKKVPECFGYKTIDFICNKKYFVINQCKLMLKKNPLLNSILTKCSEGDVRGRWLNIIPLEFLCWYKHQFSHCAVETRETCPFALNEFSPGTAQRYSKKRQKLSGHSQNILHFCWIVLSACRRYSALISRCKTVHCTQYTVHSTLYTVHCTQYTIHSTLYTVLRQQQFGESCPNQRNPVRLFIFRSY